MATTTPTSPAASTSRRSTPVRAITSSLSTRSAPPIPPSTVLFEPLVKTVLRHRLLSNIFAYSLLFSWIQTVMWSMWGSDSMGGVGFTGALLSLVWPTTLLFAVLRWAIISLPVVVLRKRYLTVNRTVASSPSMLLRNSLSSKSAVPVFVTYTICASLVALLHAPGLSLDFFVKTNDAYHLNGGFIFLFTTQITLFYGFHLRNIFLDRFTFPWAKLSSSVELWPFQSGSLLDGFVVVVLYSSICNVSAALIFAFGRGLLSLLNVVPFISPILSPLTHYFLRGPWTIFLPFLHIPLLFQSFFLSVMTLFALEFADMLFDTFVTQPVVVARSTSNPSLTAVSGITSSDMFMKYLAYSELYQIATDQSPRGLADRSALFGDTKHLPSLWTKFVRESLLLLGQDYQIVLGRGKAPPPPAPPPQPPTTPNPSQIPGTPTHLIKKSIYKTDPNASTRSTSLGTSPTALAPDPNLVIRIRDSLQPNLTQTGSLWKLWSGAVRWSHAQARGIGEGLYVRFVPLLVREAVGDFARWWRRERVHKAVEACFPRKEIDKLAIRALSHLVCASLVEDQFGVVQRDIPQILEALSSFLYAADQYHTEVNTKHTPPTLSASDTPSPQELLATESARIELEKAQETLLDVRDALKDAVARIVQTFGRKLVAFKFPVRTAERLQPFLDSS